MPRSRLSLEGKEDFRASHRRCCDSCVADSGSARFGEAELAILNEAVKGDSLESLLNMNCSYDIRVRTDGIVNRVVKIVEIKLAEGFLRYNISFALTSQKHSFSSILYFHSSQSQQ